MTARVDRYKFRYSFDRPEELLNRVASLIEPIESGCWAWRGITSNRQGRGAIFIDGRNLWAYRVVYEVFVERIPDGLTIDHLCLNPWCVNPTHCEPVTAEENMRRFIETKELCGNGLHPRSAMFRDYKGRMRCRECKRAEARRNWHKTGKARAKARAAEKVA